MIIVSLCDENYVEFAMAMVASAKINMPSAYLKIYLVNTKNFDELSKRFIELNSRCECVLEMINFTSNLQKQCYCTNRRASLMLEIRREQIQNNTRESIAWIDADSLIVKYAERIAETSENYDVILCLKPQPIKNKPAGHGRFRGGLMTVGKNKIADQFLVRYNEVVGECWKDVPFIEGCENLSVSNKSVWPIELKPVWKIWMKNQDALDAIYEEMKKNLKFALAGTEFCDTNMTEHSLIWAAKSKLKSSTKYQNELRKYLPKELNENQCWRSKE